MSKENAKTVSLEKLRHAEYYNMQETFDMLYDKSKNGENFNDLKSLILSRENILLAYRNIKSNTGNETAGTDGLTIKAIESLNAEDVVEKVRHIMTGKHGYRPKPVRRKDIPKENGATRPLGIPCIWDRLIQQCVLQILEPICEAKFSKNSFGFRPVRSTAHAIRCAYNHLQLHHLHYVVEVDIKGFFDNVNHSKLVKQIWAMGIHDKWLIYIIKKVLTAPIKMPNGTLVTPDRGTPQGGIISPLLANIVLNELDHWVESQWEENPIAKKYQLDRGAKGIDKSNGYRALKNTKMKEMRIVRYADDFRIFCRTKSDAEKVKIAVTKWLRERLRLEISPEKTRVVNTKRKYSEFLGIKMKVERRRDTHVVKSHISDKRLRNIKHRLSKQVEKIATPNCENERIARIRKYNSMVLGIQGYFNVATMVSEDLNKVNWEITKTFKNRLTKQHRCNLTKTGRKLTEKERKLYGNSQRLRFVANGEPIFPIGHVKYGNPYAIKRDVTPYSPQGREGVHQNLRINTSIMKALMKQLLPNRSAEYADNRISLFSAQQGKCAVTGKEFVSVNQIHCHHKKPLNQGGTDEYSNLTLVDIDVHRLIHANVKETIQRYLDILKLTSKQLTKVNELRSMAGLSNI